MVSKRKSPINTLSAAQVAALPCGSKDLADAASGSSSVREAITDLKERIMTLHGHAPANEKAFRLSFSILALEKSIDERQLGHIKLGHAPGIGHFIDRLQKEMESLLYVTADLPTPSTIKEPASVRETVQAGDPLDPVVLEILEISRLLKKNAEAENRKFHASTAVHYSAIQRLSERMGRIEELLLSMRPKASEPDGPEPKAVSVASDPVPIDPRPLLIAARAAAARALADSQMVALNPSDVNPEEGSRETASKPWGKTSKSHRFWKSIFAAA